MHFKSWLIRVTIEAGGIGEQIEIQILVIATARSGGAQQFPWNNDRDFAAVVDHFRNSIRVPRAQSFCGKQASVYNTTSALVGILRQFFVIPKRRLFMPVQ